MAKKGTKIYINGNKEIAEEVTVKDGQEEKERKFKEEKLVLDKGVEKFYQDSALAFEKPQRKNIPIWLFISLPILFGLIAGFFGGFFVLTREKIDLPFLKPVDLTRYFSAREITLVTEKKITIAEEQRIVEAMKVVQPSVIRIYLAQSKPVTKPASILESVYKNSEILGLGVVLTSDGWIATTAEAIPDPTKDYLVATLENKIFLVKKIVYDPLTEFVFLKTDLNDMPVAKIVDFSAINFGQKIFLFDKNSSLIQSTLVNLLARPDSARGDNFFIYSTERLPFYFMSQEKLDNSCLGAPVFTLDKSVIGLVGSSGLITPIFYLRSILPQILEKERVVRPRLGLEYLDLSEMTGLDDSRYQGFSYGAIVYGSSEIKTPATKAGLKNGDLIIKVDGLPFNGRANLTELVQAKKPGEKIEFNLVRDGKELVLVAVLGSF